MEESALPPSTAKLWDDHILPEYKSFCREKGFDIPACDIQLQLEAEAWRLFNKHKPKYTYFQGHIIEYDVWSYNGDFVHNAQPIEEFLVQVEQNQRQLKMFNGWRESIAFAFTVLIGFVCTVLLDLWAHWLVIPGAVVLLLLLLPISAKRRWFVDKRPDEKVKQRQIEANNQFAQFRQKLEKLKPMVETNR